MPYDALKVNPSCLKPSTRSLGRIFEFLFGERVDRFRLTRSLSSNLSPGF